MADNNQAAIQLDANSDAAWFFFSQRSIPQTSPSGCAAVPDHRLVLGRSGSMTHASGLKYFFQTGARGELDAAKHKNLRIRQGCLT
jgi:hypothetical protein